MNFQSTRDSSVSVSCAQAILRGLSAEGGLFVPEQFPHVSQEEIAALRNLAYPEQAAFILERWLPGFTPDELARMTIEAYSAQRFPADVAAPLVAAGDLFVLELFRGPTSAFKDFALQMLPRLISSARVKCEDTRTVSILVATSGDTGKAALEGFCDILGTKICVFYPDGGTSDIQRLQMATQRGENVYVVAVRGNFDDCQTGVKRLFTDEALARELDGAGVVLSSANSINWGRLAPQIAYYFSAYAQLCDRGVIACGEEVDFCVPTGNFGNILAGWFAKRSGLPIGQLVCASNQNNVLTDFIRTGVYDRNRPFYRTASPSMDILVSSNLERLLYLLSGRDSAKTAGLMRDLAETGRYEIGGELLAALHGEGFVSYCADDDAGAAAIREIFTRDGYLCDTHTAIAMLGARACRREGVPMVAVSTASPFKFAPAILPALGSDLPGDEFAALDALSARSGLPVPPGLAALQTLPVRFSEVCSPDEMRAQVRAWLVNEA